MHLRAAAAGPAAPLVRSPAPAAVPPRAPRCLRTSLDPLCTHHTRARSTEEEWHTSGGEDGVEELHGEPRLLAAAEAADLLELLADLPQPARHLSGASQRLLPQCSRLFTCERVSASHSRTRRSHPAPSSAPGRGDPPLVSRLERGSPTVRLLLLLLLLMPLLMSLLPSLALELLVSPPRGGGGGGEF
jgi:hypothetical protein